MMKKLEEGFQITRDTLQALGVQVDFLFWVDGRFRSEARSWHLSLTHGPAGNRTTTGSLSA